MSLEATSEAMRLAHVVPLVVLAAGCRPPGYGKGGGGGDDTVEIDAAVVTPDAPKLPDAAATCSKAFRLEGHAGASAVLLTGSFTMWAGTAPPAIALVKGGDNAWTGTADVTAGAHQYKFIVDGTWIVDPSNPDQMDDGFGGKNSVITCAP
jgi:hypothetical protein